MDSYNIVDSKIKELSSLCINEGKSLKPVKSATLFLFDHRFLAYFLCSFSLFARYLNKLYTSMDFYDSEFVITWHAINSLPCQC